MTQVAPLVGSQKLGLWVFNSPGSPSAPHGDLGIAHPADLLVAADDAACQHHHEQQTCLMGNMRTSWLRFRPDLRGSLICIGRQIDV
jgi:hypothetical protein